MRDQKRTFFLGIVNGVMFNAGNVFLDPDMVFTWLLAQLGASKMIIGLVSPIRYGGWFFPQLFVSGYLQRQPRKLPFYRLMAMIRFVAVSALIPVMLVMSPRWMVASFMILLTIYSISAGLAGIPFMDMVGRLIPPNRRGSFFAQRMFWGGVLALGAGQVVGWLLSEPDGLDFPANFAVIFVLGLVSLIISLGAWSLVHEEPEEVDRTHVRWTEQFAHGVRLLVEDRPYRTFVLMRLSLMLGQLAGPFYVVYAKEVLGVPARLVGTFITARAASAILSNPLWGWMSDHAGNRRLIQVTNVVGLSMPLVALGVGAMHELTDGMPWAGYLFTLVFVAAGAFGTGSAIGNMNYLLDIAPPRRRPLYLGFTNTLFGIGIFTSALGGVIAEWAGFTALMVIAAVLYSIALMLSSFMDELRRPA